MTEASGWEMRRLRAEGFRDGVGAALEIARRKGASARDIEGRLTALFWDRQRVLSFQSPFTNGDWIDTANSRERYAGRAR